jgi:hypothetical protein
MYFTRNWEFGSALSKHRNFGGGVEPPKPPLGTPLHKRPMPHICYSLNHAITYAWFGENAKLHPKEIGRHGMDMISVTQHWVKWQDFCEHCIKLGVPENDANFLITWGSIRYFRLWPRWDRSWGLRCGGLLHSVNFWCVTDVSERRVGTIFKVQVANWYPSSRVQTRPKPSDF